jgi:hypothetical protein
MSRVRLIHWKAAEAAELIEMLGSAGWQVDYEEKFDASSFRGLREAPPDAVAIDLSRLPSHGREVAIALRGLKATRSIPIIFVDGAPQKIEAVRAKLPDAVYTSRARLIAALGKPGPRAPVTPATMMKRYEGRSAAQKLGIAEGVRVALIDAPRDYEQVIGPVPETVSFEEDSRAIRDVTLWFVQDPAAYQAALPAMPRLAARTKLWVLWPKQSSGANSGLSQPSIRAGAAELGLVDYKICSVDKTWSGMLFAIKKNV